MVRCPYTNPLENKALEELEIPKASCMVDSEDEVEEKLVEQEEDKSNFPSLVELCTQKVS